MKQKFSIAMSLAVILAMLLTSIGLADDFSIDNDVFSNGNQNTVSLTAAPGATVNSSAQIFVDWQGQKHLEPGSAIGFTVSVSQTDLPAGYSVSSVSNTVPIDWNDTNDNFVAGISNISFTAPAVLGSYTYHVKWADTTRSCDTDQDCLAGANDYTINLEVTAPTNAAPSVDAGGPYTGAEGSLISINGASASDPDGDTLSYSWTKSESGFDAGVACMLTNANTLAPSLSCTDDGTVTLTLTVDDGHGHMPSDMATVNVTNENPVIDLVSNNGPIVEGSAATISVTAHDPGTNDVLSYAFDCDNNGSYENSTGSCSFADNVGSPFTVGVQATDDDGGSATSSTQVTVNNANPVVAAPSWTSNSVACRASATLTGISFSDAGLIDYPWNVNINWNDGSTSFSTNSQGAQADQTHIYNTPGTYAATVTVTDKDGGFGSNTTATSLTVRQIYNVTFLQPFDGSSPSNLITNTMKSGRVVPVKVVIYDVCTQTYVTDPATLVKINLMASSASASNDAVEAYADAGASNSNTLYFRWTSDAAAPGGGFWIYNLDSRTVLNGSALTINTTYRVDVYVANVKVTETTWALLKPVK